MVWVQKKKARPHLRLKLMSWRITREKKMDVCLWLGKLTQLFISPVMRSFPLSLTCSSSPLFFSSTRSASCTLWLRPVRMRQVEAKEWRCLKMSRTRKKERRDSTHTKSTICRGKQSCVRWGQLFPSFHPPGQISRLLSITLCSCFSPLSHHLKVFFLLPQTTTAFQGIVLVNKIICLVNRS